MHPFVLLCFCTLEDRLYCLLSTPSHSELGLSVQGPDICCMLHRVHAVSLLSHWLAVTFSKAAFLPQHEISCSRPSIELPGLPLEELGLCFSQAVC